MCAIRAHVGMAWWAKTISIPTPDPNSLTARNNRNKRYIVYEVYSMVLRGTRYSAYWVKHTWKYGISRVGGSRPASQLGKCGRQEGRTCHYTIRAWVRGWYEARMLEATYISLYAARYGHCPIGNPACI
jgi:hypothetical protein